MWQFLVFLLLQIFDLFRCKHYRNIILKVDASSWVVQTELCQVLHCALQVTCYWHGVSNF